MLIISFFALFVAAATSPSASKDPPSLVVEEGQYGELRIPRSSIKHQRINVILPPYNVRLAWESSDASLRIGPRIDKIATVYTFDVKDNSGSKDLVLRVSAFPIKDKAEIEVISGGSTIKQVPLVVQPRQSMSRKKPAHVGKVAFNQGTALSEEKRREVQYSGCPAGGQCYGIASVWLEDKINKIQETSVERADKELFAKLREHKAVWFKARVLQKEQFAFGKELRRTRFVEHTKLFPLDLHSEFITARLKRKDIRDGETSATYLINWMTRDAKSEFAITQTKNHAMAFAYHHSSDNNGEHSFSFFDANAGSDFFSDKDLDVVKNAAITFFQKTLVKRYSRDLFDQAEDTIRGVLGQEVKVVDQLLWNVFKVPSQDFSSIVTDFLTSDARYQQLTRNSFQQCTSKNPEVLGTGACMCSNDPCDQTLQYCYALKDDSAPTCNAKPRSQMTTTTTPTQETTSSSAQGVAGLPPVVMLLAMATYHLI